MTLPYLYTIVSYIALHIHVAYEVTFLLIYHTYIFVRLLYEKIVFKKRVFSTFQNAKGDVSQTSIKSGVAFGRFTIRSIT